MGPTIPSGLRPVRHDPGAIAEARAAAVTLLRALEHAADAREDAVAAVTGAWEGLLATRFTQTHQPHLRRLLWDARSQLHRTIRELDVAVDRIAIEDGRRGRLRAEWVEQWHRRQHDRATTP